jgi:hypothetical protein
LSEFFQQVRGSDDGIYTKVQGRNPFGNRIGMYFYSYSEVFMTIDPLSLLIGFLAGGSIIGLYLEVRNNRQEIKEIKQDQTKRLPHGTLATLEDIHAVINDVRFQNVEVEKIIKSLMISEAMREYEDRGLQRIKELIADIQDNPRNYKDRPNRKVNVV